MMFKVFTLFLVLLPCIYSDGHRCADQIGTNFVNQHEKCGSNEFTDFAGFFGSGRECPESGCTPDWCCTSYCFQTFGSISPSPVLTNACVSGEFINSGVPCPTFPCEIEFCCEGAVTTGTGDFVGGFGS